MFSYGLLENGEQLQKKRSGADHIVIIVNTAVLRLKGAI